MVRYNSIDGVYKANNSAECAENSVNNRTKSFVAIRGVQGYESRTMRSTMSLSLEKENKAADK